MEHGAHVQYLRSIPCADVLVEVVQVLDVSDTACVPSTDGLVKGSGSVKHIGHVSDSRRIPRPDGLVELRSIGEHALHGSDIARVPSTDGLIKGTGSKEHVFHVNDCRCVPSIKWLIEIGSLVEHLVHCLHTCCVPRALALSKRTFQILFPETTYQLSVGPLTWSMFASGCRCYQFSPAQNRHNLALTIDVKTDQNLTLEITI